MATKTPKKEPSKRGPKRQGAPQNSDPLEPLDEIMYIRCTASDKKRFEEKQRKDGFRKFADWARFKLDQD
jgi:hypothetical protein